MYCKLFSSLYEGTLRGRSHEILVFTNLLAYCNAKGEVDRHFRAVSEETGITIDEVKAAIINLEAPDPESRSPECDGARLIRMDGHRAWGWKVVNYAKYRAIRHEDDRREQNREAQERWRNSKQNKPSSAEPKQKKLRKPRKAQVEAEAYAIHRENTFEGQSIAQTLDTWDPDFTELPPPNTLFKTPAEKSIFPRNVRRRVEEPNNPV